MSTMKTLAGMFLNESTLSAALEKAIQNPDKIAKATKYSPQQIQKALKWAQTDVLPNACKSIKDIKSGGSFLGGLGVGKSDIKQMTKEYGGHLPKMGLTDAIVAPLMNSVPDNSQPVQKSYQSNGYTPFDRSKFPKL